MRSSGPKAAIKSQRLQSSPEGIGFTESSGQEEDGETRSSESSDNVVSGEVSEEGRVGSLETERLQRTERQKPSLRHRREGEMVWNRRNIQCFSLYCLNSNSEIPAESPAWFNRPLARPTEKGLRSNRIRSVPSHFNPCYKYCGLVLISSYGGCANAVPP